eukprot:366286-Chlamydomonas_euryale.AAC.9
MYTDCGNTWLRRCSRPSASWFCCSSSCTDARKKSRTQCTGSGNASSSPAPSHSTLSACHADQLHGKPRSERNSALRASSRRFCVRVGRAGASACSSNPESSCQCMEQPPKRAGASAWNSHERGQVPAHGTATKEGRCQHMEQPPKRAGANTWNRDERGQVQTHRAANKEGRTGTAMLQHCRVRRLCTCLLLCTRLIPCPAAQLHAGRAQRGRAVALAG